MVHTSSIQPRWVILTWQEASGDVYCCELEPPCNCQVGTDFNRSDGTNLSAVMAPRPKPVMSWAVQGDIRECRKFPQASFQQAIDTTQRMVRDHRP